MERLRTPFFTTAMVAIGLVVLVEIGATWILGGRLPTTELAGRAGQVGLDVPGGGNIAQPTGVQIPYLALIDVILLFTIALMGLGLVVPDRLLGRVQGLATLIGSIVLILTALALLIVAFVLLILMVTLLLAFPFGTIAYLIIWGFFPRGQAAAVLALLMFLKLFFAGTLVVAQPRFLQNKGLVALVLTSLVANLVAAFLLALVPGFLVSITDALGGVVFAIVAIVWGIILLIGSIPAVIAAAKATAASAKDAADVSTVATAVATTAAQAATQATPAP
jgi:hypothetical protein